LTSACRRTVGGSVLAVLASFDIARGWDGVPAPPHAHARISIARVTRTGLVMVRATEAA
jgi:hypothetical protein